MNHSWKRFSSFSLTRLLWVCPRHVQFNSQSEIWAEFTCRIWCSLSILWFLPTFSNSLASLVAQMVKNLPPMRETWVWSLDGEDSLKKGMATHSRILVWEIAWKKKSGGLQSHGVAMISFIIFQLLQFSSVQFSHSVVSDSLRPHESQHARPPCPSPTPRVYANSYPSNRWCHPAISSSIVPFSSCPQSLPASGSFPMSQLFAWGSQSIGVSASASVLPMNTQDWSPLEWTRWISLQSKGLSRVFFNTLCSSKLETGKTFDFYPVINSKLCMGLDTGPNTRQIKKVLFSPL